MGASHVFVVVVVVGIWRYGDEEVFVILIQICMRLF